MNSGSTWPEQDAVNKWLKERGFTVGFNAAMDLKEAVTKPRLEIQRDLARVTQERDALRKKLDEAFERAAQLAYEYCSDSGLTTKTRTNHGSRLSAEIRSLKTEGT